MKARHLGSILDEIEQYKKILVREGYCLTATPGKAPWSNNHTHENRTSIDINGSGWIVYDASGTIANSGYTPRDLDSLFFSNHTKDLVITK